MPDVNCSPNGADRRRSGATARSFWSPQEDAGLIVRYNRGDAEKQIAQDMGRSLLAICSRVHRLRKRSAPLRRRYQCHPDPAPAPLEIGITEEDRQWMEKYQRQAARRRARAKHAL